MTGETFRADNETRTRDLNLGKVALYQLSYVRLHFGRFTGLKCEWNSSTWLRRAPKSPPVACPRVTVTAPLE